MLRPKVSKTIIACEDHKAPPDEAPPLQPAKLAYTIKQVRVMVGISRTNLCKAIKDGELKAEKYGRRTLILAEDLQRWIYSWRQPSKNSVVCQGRNRREIKTQTLSLSHSSEPFH
jgi:excisionase family DNA binding protein